jgi:hypothetical protein
MVDATFSPRGLRLSLDKRLDLRPELRPARRRSRSLSESTKSDQALPCVPAWSLATNLACSGEARPD